MIRRFSRVLAMAALGAVAACAPSDPPAEAAEAAVGEAVAETSATPAATTAAAAPTVPPASPCGNATSQTEMNACYAREAEAATARLDSLMTSLGSSLGVERAASLRQVQASWMAYRDGQCAWEGAAAEGGSIAPTVVATCRAREARERIDELQIHLCEGGGMTGECAASRRYDP